MEALFRLVFILGGAFSIFCSVKDYDWFFNNHRAKPFVFLLGRNGARVFYILLGIFIIVVSFLIDFSE